MRKTESKAIEENKEHYINQLRKELLNATNNLHFELDNNLLTAGTDAVHKALNCYECSLWSININETVGGGKNNSDVSQKQSKHKNAYSTSLIHRKLSENCPYVFKDPDGYVHDLKRKSYFKGILQYAKKGKLFYRNTDAEVLEFKHRIPDFVKAAELSDFIVIPITRREIEGKNTIKKPVDLNLDDVIALLELSYQSCDIKDDDSWNEIAAICQHFFSTAFCRYRLIRQQRIVDDLMKVHDDNKDYGVKLFFEDVINVLRKNYLPCQASSFFMWDSYHNRYNIIATTGIKGNPKLSDVYYFKDQGLTGMVASTAKPKIIESISKNYKYTWCEETSDKVKTALFIPVTVPSNDKEVIGILRFVNKKNNDRPEYLDYFNDEDVEIMLFVSKYLAFAIESFIKEEDHGNFISKLYHETATPANAIHKTAYTLIKRKNEPDFLEKYFEPWLNNIIDFAQFQYWQASSNLYLSKNRRIQTFETRYTIDEYSLKYILQKSKELIRPIAKKEHVRFDSIDLIGLNVPDIILKIDKNAFITIFYNLFSNAIKYHEQTPRDKEGLYMGFRVEVSYRITDITLEISVKDWGIGIKKNDKKAIFQVGYRTEEAIRENSNGFGVGLSVIKQIIVDFGGYIEVKNNNKPTVFEIVLPKELIK